MNLISCDECGVVLDASKLSFAEDTFDGVNDLIEGSSVWCSTARAFVPVVPCPVCKEPIKEPRR